MTTRLAIFWITALIAIMNSSRFASANDTEAAIGLGGLVFTKSNDIEMLSEELFVSTEQIIVKYRFRNKARDNVATLVAFPLPEVKYDPDNEFGFRGNLDVDDFRTTVDGNTLVKPALEQKALLRGNDETQTLKRYGIPLNPYAAHEAISSERESTKDELRRLALIDEDGSPTWSLKKSFFWQQVFPFHQEITVEHRYRPIVGGTVYTSLGASKQSDELLAFNEKFCVDEGFVRAVESKTKKDSLTEYYSTSFSENWIEYVLTTGANWSGPIRKFRLVVDKGRERNLVSFCGEGIRKIGPTLFEFAATDFVPKKDLFVLILLPLETATTDSGSPTGSLEALSCEELWLRRNSIFKAAGYCFKAPRAISKFGNSGCSFDHVDHVPLSKADRVLVAQISSLEQSKACVR